MIRAPLAAGGGLFLAAALPLRAQEPAAADTSTAELVRTWTMPDTVGVARTRVTGWIVDARTGAPLAGARIGIPRLRRSAVTGRKGEFTLEGVPVGAWPAMLRLIGYRAEVMMLPVDAAGVEVTLSLTPEAVVLEGVDVVVDRFAQRRRAFAQPVRVFSGATLQYESGSAREVLTRRLNVAEVPCESMLGQPILSAGPCIRIRSFAVAPKVFIDERPAPSGLYELDMYDGSELALVEVVAGGHMIRAYTAAFLEWAARTGYTPEPYPL